MKFNYYYGNQADQFSFIRIPRVLLVDPLFAPLTIQAKLLYGVLLDRMGMSMRNGWLDEENRVYIIYQIAEIQEDLGFSKKKAIDFLTELENFGLVEKKRRGRGLPSILYVKSFMDHSNKTRSAETDTSTAKSDEGRSAKIDTSMEQDNEVRSTEIDTSTTGKTGINSAETGELMQENQTRSTENEPLEVPESTLLEVPKSTLLEVPKSTPLKNYNNINNIYKNNNKSNLIVSQEEDKMRYDEILKAYKKTIKDNIEFDSLLISYPYDKELLEGILDMMLEILVSQSDQILVASERYPAALVKSKFMKLNYLHIEYVLSCFKGNTTKVKNIKKYLLAALFNAPTTINGYYSAEVQHDYPQYVG